MVCEDCKAIYKRMITLEKEVAQLKSFKRLVKHNREV